jgi:hypothetical protein
MMVEIFANVIQTVVTLIAGVGAGILFYKNRNQVYFLLTCFYGTFTLGTLYWTLHVFLFKYTPPIFYVSDLTWVASFTFLLTLKVTLSTVDERKFRHSAMWLVPIFCVPQTLLYLTHGDILFNLLSGGITMVIAWYSARGLFYARSQGGKLRDMQFFYAAVLCIVFLEYCLWTASCFWVSDTLTNPYFWIDFILTVALFALLPATRKAVGT